PATRGLPACPTRRSSDLAGAAAGAGGFKRTWTVRWVAPGRGGGRRPLNSGLVPPRLEWDSSPSRHDSTSSFEMAAAYLTVHVRLDRKSTRLNSSHLGISY